MGQQKKGSQYDAIATGWVGIDKKKDQKEKKKKFEDKAPVQSAYNR